MKEFKGNTALVTGAARGIGRAICRECARRGMNVVMADIDMEALAGAEDELRALGAPGAMAAYCDVTRLESVQELAGRALDRFGTVEMLFCNAGVTALGDVVNTPLRDFEFCIRTDLYSVFYFLRTFVPFMRSQRKPCHIEVTASAASFSCTPGMPIYHAAKQGVLGLCEPVYYDFLTWGDPIGMTILCPGMVKTDISSCDDRRPEQFKIDWNDPYYSGLVYQSGRQASVNDTSIGQSPEEVVEMLFKAIEDDRLYCHTRPQLLDWADYRLKVMRGQERYNIGMFMDFMKHDGKEREGSGDEGV
mgnify:CR=1 FL=1